MVRGWWPTAELPFNERTNAGIAVGALLATVLVTLLAGCAGGPTERVAAAPRGQPSSGLLLTEPTKPPKAVVPSAPSPADDDATPAEDLGAADDVVDATLAIAARLTAEERHLEALAALEAALAQSGAPALAVAKAGVLRDLGRRHLALQCLRDLVSAYGADAMHPGLLFERAELEWIEGHRAAAEAALTELRRVHGNDGWMTRHAAEVRGLQRELADADRPERLRVRDLLGNLRGAPDAGERLRNLQLATAPLQQHDGVDPVDASHLRAMVVAIAAGDESPTLRAHALRLADVDVEFARELCEAGLADPAPLVRTVAATRAMQLLRGDAVPLLLAALSNETDATAFRSMHDALVLLVQGGPNYRVGDEDDAERRALLLAGWRRAVAARGSPR